VLQASDKLLKCSEISKQLGQNTPLVSARMLHCYNYGYVDRELSGQSYLYKLSAYGLEKILGYESHLEHIARGTDKVPLREKLETMMSRIREEHCKEVYRKNEDFLKSFESGSGKLSGVYLNTNYQSHGG